MNVFENIGPELDDKYLKEECVIRMRTMASSGINSRNSSFQKLKNYLQADLT